MRHFKSITLLLLAACASYPPATDVLITAERQAWDAPNWKTSFTKTHAFQHVDDPYTGPSQFPRKVRLSENFWSDVTRVIKSSDFEALPPQIEQTPDPSGRIQIRPDDDTQCISIQNGTSKHKVCGNTLTLEITPEGARFRQLWDVLVTAVPEPKR